MSVSDLSLAPIDETAPFEIEHEEEESPRYWTDTKIKQVWLGFLSGAIAIVATTAIVIAIQLTPIEFLSALPLYVIAGVLYGVAGAIFWHTVHLIDYENPAHLQQARLEAATMNLPQVVEKHGWENLFRWEVLAPEQFERAYRNQVESLRLKDLVSYYETALQHAEQVQKRDRYSIPSPFEWRGKLLEETHRYNFRQLIRGYPLEMLIRYSLLDPAVFHESFTSYANGVSFLEAVSCYQEAQGALQRAHFSLPNSLVQNFFLEPLCAWAYKYRQETSPLSCREIVERYPIQLLLQERVIEEDEYLFLQEAQGALKVFEVEKAELERQYLERTIPYRQVRDAAKELAETVFHTYQFDERIFSIEKERQKCLDLLREVQSEPGSSLADEEALQALIADCEERTSQLVREQEMAWQLKESALLLADAQCQMSIDPLFREKELWINECLCKREQKLTSLNWEYAEWRRLKYPADPIRQGA